MRFTCGRGGGPGRLLRWRSFASDRRWDAAERPPAGAQHRLTADLGRCVRRDRDHNFMRYRLADAALDALNRLHFFFLARLCY